MQWAHWPPLCRQGPAGLGCMPVFPHMAVGHLQKSMGVVFLSKLGIFPGKIVRKFPKVSEMEFLSLFLAKKDYFCGSN